MVYNITPHCPILKSPISKPPPLHPYRPLALSAQVIITTVLSLPPLPATTLSLSLPRTPSFPTIPSSGAKTLSISLFPATGLPSPSTLEKLDAVDATENVECTLFKSVLSADPLPLPTGLTGVVGVCTLSGVDGRTGSGSPLWRLSGPGGGRSAGGGRLASGGGIPGCARPALRGGILGGTTGGTPVTITVCGGTGIVPIVVAMCISIGGRNFFPPPPLRACPLRAASSASSALFLASAASRETCWCASCFL